MFRYLPEQASEIAPKIDALNNLITDLSLFFTVAIVGTMLYFAIRYRRTERNLVTPRIEGSHALEIVWSVVPIVISVYVMYWGVVYFRELREVPEDAMTIAVTGQKWIWDFEYENGKKTSGEFVVPVHTPIKLLMRSTDVLHSFFIPAMRVKHDVIPGRYTYVSFTPVKTGTFHSFCTEYCGDMHWNMLATLRVVSQAEYSRWVEDKSEQLMAERMSPVELGGKLYAEKGCNACHSLDGTPRVGPSYLKSFGREVALTDGKKVTADENYLREAILNPNAEIVAGFQPNLMPAFEGQLDDKQIDGLIAFIKSIDGSQPAAEVEAPAVTEVDTSKMSPAERGEHLYNTKLCVTCHSLDGSKLVGPTFQGIWGREGELADGTAYVVDEAYVKDSIRNPNNQLVKGFAGGMIPFPESQLSDEDINDIIEFMKTLE